MAKKKRRRKSLGTNLKYEVYGILLITISIIALSGEAAVGRSLSKLFGLVLGKFYFVLAVVGIVIGLTVMIKRAWPKGWTNKRTGLLILVLAFTLMSSISEIEQKLSPTVDLTGTLIFKQLSSDLQLLLISVPVENDLPIRDKEISGGYVGAIQYAMFFSLFGYYGAKLIMFVMFAISIMLMTGKSYVELGRVVSSRGTRMFKLLASKWAKRSTIRASAAASGSTGQGELDDDDTIDDEHDDYVAAPPKKRRSLFFSWRSTADKVESDTKEEGLDDWVFEPNSADTAIGSKPAWLNEIEAPWEKSGTDIHNAPVPNELEHTQSEPWVNDEKGFIIDPDIPEVVDEAPWIENGIAPIRAEESMQSSDSDDWEDDADINEEPDASEQASENLQAGSEALEVDENHVQAVPRRPISAEEAVTVKPYQLPPFSLLTKPNLMSKNADATDMYDSRRKLEATLESFGVRAKVLDVVRGPAVTRYEVQPATGVKVSRIVGLTDDIALALAAKDIRMEAPIPGKSAIGIEVPNMEVSVVTMREVMETATFQNAASKLSIAFGRDISGQTIVGNLAKMPHLLVAGATGSGKSVCINGIITSILYKAAPDEVKFLMIDPKMVELNVYNGIPHLLAPVVTNPKRASLALKKIVVEMESRYELFSKSATRNIEGYNTLMADNPAAVLPYIVVIVDELADLMMVAANDVEDSIARLAQMARAAGIHLIIATQRPSVDVITGVIKANIPSRIAFGVSSQVDSRTILDMVGAEKLLGRGDMLFLPVGMSKPIRVQGAFLSDQEVETLVNFARGQAEAEYKEDLVPEVEEESAEGNEMLDELYDQAVQIIIEAKQASVSLLQRRMRIGYTRAARLIDQMEARSIVGPYEGSKPREVLITMDQFQAGKVSS
ncbi:S-DNA-T family DNA segregation ATPase FtsK/SpoIIIE [Paenibacillus endophyticus]|uniref:S-DNA-T family DNA segregation ATPase FtsK/SpoIIIE n=1 Tax=Paenibacillus endophyticus TaxID=1294268 RepID=A0A7W5C6W8_9BACL|nr:DNA translocase FtsK [Paenibacillus endophyticus]MBB3152047.1 S-DNA-T family DNA segregation ATPase FtsK/SpoIIIE [Paenibacillus endophyticus]